MFEMKNNSEANNPSKHDLNSKPKEETRQLTIKEGMSHNFGVKRH